MKYGLIILLLLFKITSLYSQKEEGGLLFLKEELIEVINSNPEYTGLIFKLKNTESLDLHVFAVKWKKLEDIEHSPADLINFQYQKGISMETGEVSDDLNKFEYDFKETLLDSKFQLAFITKDQIEQLALISESRLILSAMIFNGGKLLGSNESYFTFKLQPYDLLNNVLLTRIDLPAFQIMPPCPPLWTRGLGDDPSTTEKVDLSVKKIFVKSLEDKLNKFTAIYLQEKSNVQLKWKIGKLPPDCTITIFRKSELTEFSPIHEMNINICGGNSYCIYLDESVEQDQYYEYSIQLEYNIAFDQPIKSEIVKVYTGNP